MASLMKAVDESRARYQALHRNLILNGQSILACDCWHHSAYGLEKLQTQLAHMQLVAQKMRETLLELQRLERRVLAPAEATEA